MTPEIEVPDATRWVGPRERSRSATTSTKCMAFPPPPSGGKALQRPRADEPAQRHARDRVEGGLVDDDQREQRRAARVLDGGDRVLHGLAGAEDVVDDDDLLVFDARVV